MNFLRFYRNNSEDVEMEETTAAENSLMDTTIITPVLENSGINELLHRDNVAQLLIEASEGNVQDGLCWLSLFGNKIITSPDLGKAPCVPSIADLKAYGLVSDMFKHPKKPTNGLIRCDFQVHSM